MRYRIIVSLIWIGMLSGFIPGTVHASPQYSDYVDYGDTIVNAAGLCLDIHAPDIYRDGGRVQVYTCNGEPQQQWHFDDQQRLVNEGGKCLDVHAPDAGTNGGRVQIWECLDGANQKWSYENEHLVNGQGLCLSSKTPSWHENGGIVEVWQCGIGLHQRWAVFNGPQSSGQVLMTTTEGCKRYNPLILHTAMRDSAGNAMNVVILDQEYGAYYVNPLDIDLDGNVIVYWHCAGSKDDYTVCPPGTNGVDITRPVPELAPSRKFAVSCLTMYSYS